VQLLFTSALALALSALTVHFRDLRDVLSNLLTLWFFATPIIYPMHTAPADMAWLLNLNPMTHIMRSYQQVMFFEGPLGHQKYLVLVGAISVALFLAGYFVFDRLRDSFAEEV
jgi:ABC-type polysaccharide/polyol phosphate export permease